MKTLNLGTKKHTQVLILDSPSFGGACHRYSIEPCVALAPDDPMPEPVALINFQEGPVKEHGVNGCHQEDLLNIVLHRLKGFQKGDFACRENALAITKIEEALHWLNHRTREREEQGVEGTNNHRVKE